MTQSSARLANRDLLNHVRLELDCLEAHERATYLSGTWLGARVTSAKLRGERKTTPGHTDVAELAARCAVQAERMGEQG